MWIRLQRWLMLTIILCLMLLVTLPLIHCGGGGERENTLRIETMIESVPASADWIACQDGSGAWTPLTPRGTGIYETKVTSGSGKYGVAIAHSANNATRVRIVHATIWEIRHLSLEIGNAAPSVVNHRISGTVSGVISGQAGYFGVKDNSDSGLGVASYILSNVAPGTYDLLGMRGVGDVIDRMILFRDLEVKADTVRSMDFEGADSFAPVRFDITLNDGGSGRRVGWELITDRGTTIRRSLNAATMSGFGFPAAKSRPGDLYTAWGQEVFNPGTGEQVRYSQVCFRAPTSQTLSLPPAFDGTVTDAAISPYVRLKADWSPYPGVSHYRMEATRSSHNWRVILTAGWADGETSYTVPDFQSVAGWNNLWGFDSTDYERSFMAVRTNLPVRDHLRLDGMQRWLDGAQFSHAGPI
jgi:hypothetical protein